MAPGVHKVDGDDPLNYQPQMGTSMAAPHVTGIIALLLSLDPDLSVEQMRAALYSTASGNFFTGLVPNISWGQGRVSAGAAYQALSIPAKMEE
jgi:subtilisin family serine protease